MPSHRDDSPRVKRALVSVSDKTGLIEFCRGLYELGVEIISTSGTAKALREAGIEVRSLDTVTGYPEILQGRVKTLHPKIHGGILLRRRDPEQAREAATLGLEPIDMVVVNLYPFAAAAARASSPYSREVIEQIDIGGVTLIRAAAKNFEDVAVCVSPEDYAATLKELEVAQGQLALETRRRLALAAFQHTAGYDAMISTAWDDGQRPAAAPAGLEKFPEKLSVSYEKVQDLRYGENPHQRAALYVPAGSGAKPSFEQLHGKELSYNNLLDAAGTWEAACEYQQPAVAIFKHVTPCGVAVGKTLEEAFEKAWACDPLSAFGGVLAVNRPFTKAIADLLAKRFVEVITAPEYEPEALELLKKKPNIRLLLRRDPPSHAVQLRSIGAEILATEPDRMTFGDSMKVVTKRAPSKDEEAALRFAWTACKHVKSNAIVVAGPDAVVGIGAGQMSRVDSVHIAGVKLHLYLKDHPKPDPMVLASDAFFPFRDGLDAAATLGISAVIQPGGSVRDAEVIAAADEKNLAMIFTGMRHFRH
ncbi:MAG: bifunctional phosphoribosylaminoimidazolecarboxamide formyltransferase/IMP cyclohydrolase [Elusimicrobia bacterium]|nr:bifunctional phosphoribosylaminoimidazolecarboxamide formyltransferase/IMP cyclohydrolase [Elusimicrobiota bacterium]